MVVSLTNVWTIFTSIFSVTGPLLGVTVGFLVARLFAVLLAGFFYRVRDAALKYLKKGG
jgi:multisubunit Na+/H+ antiporter MnhE subunit